MHVTAVLIKEPQDCTVFKGVGFVALSGDAIRRLDIERSLLKCEASASAVL